jgi:hypothetical protein
VSGKRTGNSAQQHYQTQPWQSPGLFFAVTHSLVTKTENTLVTKNRSTTGFSGFVTTVTKRLGNKKPLNHAI